MDVFVMNQHVAGTQFLRTEHIDVGILALLVIKISYLIFFLSFMIYINIPTILSYRTPTIGYDNTTRTIQQELVSSHYRNDFAWSVTICSVTTVVFIAACISSLTFSSKFSLFPTVRRF